MPLFKKKTPPVLIKTALAGSCPPFTGIWKTKTALSKVEKEHLLNYRKISTEFQDSIGLDIICEGELARSVGSTHPFYESAYIYYFAQFLEGVDNNICIKNKISLLDPTFINEDYEDTKRFTKKPIKVTLPGPVTFVERVKNEYYKSKVELIEDYSVALKEQIKSLIDLGVEYIHIDDPHYLYMGETHELYSVKKDIMTEIVELDKKDTKFVVHMCLWNPFKEDLEHHNTKCDINSYYLNPNAFEIDSIENIDFLNIERANKNHTKFFTNKLQSSVMFGLVSVSNFAIESEESIRKQIRRLIKENAKKPNGIIISPSCGMKHFDLGIAAKKISNMVSAVNYFRS